MLMLRYITREPREMMNIHLQCEYGQSLYLLMALVGLVYYGNYKSEQDVIILVSENVRESTKQQFREIGCQIREIKNIENPFRNF